MHVKTNHKHKKIWSKFLDDNLLLNQIEKVTNISRRWEYIRNRSWIRFFNWYDIKKGANLISFEIDDDLIGLLNKKFKKYDNFTLKHMDF